jgi:glycyl-tRNA synthetase beta chain
LAAGVVEPAIINSRVKALGAIREELPEDMDDLATAYARANNLRDAELGTDVDAGALAGVRADLLSAVNAAQGQVEAALGATDYTAAVKALAALRAPIDTFFDQVKVMADDAAEREQNLKLLNAFVGVFAQVADFGKLAKKK